MYRLACFVCLLTAAAVSPALAAPEDEAAARQLEAERSRLDRDVRRPLEAQLRELRDALAREGDLADARSALASAERGLQMRLESDPRIVEAGRARRAADEALAQAALAAAATDPDVADFKAQLAEAQAEADRAAAGHRAAALKFDEARRRLWEHAAMAPFSAKVTEADRARRSARETSPAILAARQRRDEARRAFDEKVKMLPEAKALAEAEKAYYSALATDEGIRAAEAQARAAREAQAKQLEALLASDAEAAAAQAEFKAAEETARLARDRVLDLRNMVRDAEREAALTAPEAVEARQAAEAAALAARQAADQATAAERQAVEAARAALAKAFQAKVASDPRVADLSRRIAEVRARTRAIDAQLGTRKSPSKKKTAQEKPAP